MIGGRKCSCELEYQEALITAKNMGGCRSWAWVCEVESVFGGMRTGQESIENHLLSEANDLIQG